MSKSKSKETFDTVKPDGWSYVKQDITGGAQSNVCVVEHQDGRLGVLKKIKPSSDPDDNLRFLREFKILTDSRYFHPSVITIYDYSIDDLWHISQFGENFKEYWRQQKIRFKGDSDGLLQQAIKHIIEVTEGLLKLHDQGVYHRDIKPANMVLIDDRACLIDFGVAFDHTEPRITPVNDAVGNIRYSPDAMRGRQSEVGAWVDIYMLAQLLINLVEDPPPKAHWNRPVDWRYVKYPEDMNPRHITACVALTAVCSVEETCPQNAKEFLELLSNLFAFSNDSGKKDDLNENIERIMEAQKAAESQLRSVQMESTVRVLPEFVLFQTVLNSLIDFLNQTVNNINSTGMLPISIPGHTTIEDFRNKIIQSSTTMKNDTIYQLECGDEPGKAFTFRIGTTYYPANHGKSDGPAPDEISFKTYIQVYCNERFLEGTEFVTRTLWLTIGKLNEIRITKDTNKHYEIWSIEQIQDAMSDMLLDQNNWSALKQIVR